MRTAEKWLKMPEDEQAIEVANLTTPKPEGESGTPWRHTFRNYEDKCCMKCSMQAEFSGPCPIPDPVDLEDFNGAIAAFREQEDAPKYLYEIYMLEDGEVHSLAHWIAFIASAVHYWLAAAMAAERSNE